MATLTGGSDGVTVISILLHQTLTRFLSASSCPSPLSTSPSQPVHPVSPSPISTSPSGQSISHLNQSIHPVLVPSPSAQSIHTVHHPSQLVHPVSPSPLSTSPFGQSISLLNQSIQQVHPPNHPFIGVFEPQGVVEPQKMQEPLC